MCLCSSAMLLEHELDENSMLVFLCYWLWIESLEQSEICVEQTRRDRYDMYTKTYMCVYRVSECIQFWIINNRFCFIYFRAMRLMLNLILIFHRIFKWKTVLHSIFWLFRLIHTRFYSINFHFNSNLNAPFLQKRGPALSPKNNMNMHEKSL